MRRKTKFRFSRCVAVLVAAAFVVLPPIAAHETGQTVGDPGFRPDSGLADAFVTSVEDARVAVYPAIVRRQTRTAHSFASQRLIVDLLNEKNITTAAPASYRVKLGRLLAAPQWELFQNDLQAIAEQLQGRKSEADYHLFMEFLLPVSDQSIFGIQCYVLDRNRENAFSFLLNSHHRSFAEADLVAENSTEEARDIMIEKATMVGVTALIAQIEQASEATPPGPVLHETPIDEMSSLMSFSESDVGPGLAAEKSLRLMCECVNVTLEKSHRYFRIEDPGQVDESNPRFKVSFYDEPPPDLTLVQFSVPVIPVTEPGQWIIDAAQAAPYCDMWPTHDDRRSAVLGRDTPSGMPSFCTDARKTGFPANERPMYGNIEKSSAQLRADADYIENMTSGGRGRETAAELVARVAWNAYYAGDCATAIRRFNQAWLLDAENQLALWGFAVIALERNKTDEAIRYFRMAVDVGPDNAGLRDDYDRAMTMVEQ